MPRRTSTTPPPRKLPELPAVTWIEWMRDSVANLGNNWCGGPSAAHHRQAVQALLEAEAAWLATSDRTPTKHLWEYDHPYIGPECENTYHYESWEEFLEGVSARHEHYNLMFRWDWIRRPDDWEPEYTGEPAPPEHLLRLFFVRQRKAGLGSETIEVSAQDEEAVRAWLRTRVAYLMLTNEGV